MKPSKKKKTRLYNVVRAAEAEIEYASPRRAAALAKKIASLKPRL